jgi:hypothetical protein
MSQEKTQIVKLVMNPRQHKTPYITSSLLEIALEYAIRMVHDNKVQLQLNGTNLWFVHTGLFS